MPALVFYPRHAIEALVKYGRFLHYAAKLLWMRYRVRGDPASRTYTDLAITPVRDAEGEMLEMFALSDASRAAVEKAKRQKALVG